MKQITKFRSIPVTFVRNMCSCIDPKVKDLYGSLRSTTPDAYNKMRDMMLSFEHASSMGSNLAMSKQESSANTIIMKEKSKEYKSGILDPSKFAPGYHIFHVLKKVRSSKLFRLLKAMPKGGVLHAHDTALCSTDYLMKLTYRENLWICHKDDGCTALAFRFSKEMPKIKVHPEACWERMSEYRKRRGDGNVTKYLYKRFSMFPLASFKTNNEAWAHFMGIFILLDGLLLYAPVWADYYYNALKEFHADGVQYLEVRSLLPELYDEDGKKMAIKDTVAIYKCTLDKFMRENPDFIGSKLIYAPLRGVPNDVMDQYVKTVKDLKKSFPDFLIGFDLVGQEELGRPLKDFIQQLLKIPKDINFYFHAGETNWYGSDIDENLIDAVLLGTKRIGHGYAVVKHPLIMRLVKCLGIAIEVCPISNQVLQLGGQDYRNHPAATLFAENIPVVISSDDPSFWRATPLSHDFYMAFLGIASSTSDIGFLKKLATNSLKYSGLNADEKADALKKWNKNWDTFCKAVGKCSCQM